MSASALNAQIVDSVAATSTLVVGQAPASAQAMVDLAAAHALGALLHGAVHRHQQSATSGAAAATAACARILAARRLTAVPPEVSPVPPSPVTGDKPARAAKEG
jgi:hypothetical protein